MSILSCVVAGICLQGAVEQAVEAGASPVFYPDVFSIRDCPRRQLDLNGTWEFRRDPDGVGVNEGWHLGEGAFDQTVQVPGAPQAQGIGDPHPHQKTAFDDPFWVRRRFEGPDRIERERLWLRIGGILPAADVYINGAHVGYTKSSRTPQRVDVTGFVTAGQENLIAVKVCELPEVRMDGLLEWNEGTQHWHGVYRPVALEIANRTCVHDIYTQPDLAGESLGVDLTLTEPAGEGLRVVLEADDDGKRVGRAEVRIEAGETEASGAVRLKEFTPWSPECPKLYTLRVTVFEKGAKEALDTVAMRFGMREITTVGAKFFLNGDPLYMRAYGDDHYYPDTLCPPWDIDWYRPRLARARAYGMNAVKACVDTIPPDYLEAADEAGILVIQEMPFGLSTLRGNRNTIGERSRAYYAEELDGIVRISRNHASVVAFSMSSELPFTQQTQESFDFFSKQLPAQTRELAPHALVIDCTGYVNSEDTEKGVRDTDFYASVHPKWRKEVLDETNMETDGKHPTILHEYNWWSCYPDPANRYKYDGAQLIPFWYDTLLKTAWENGQGELIPLYRKNSQWLQALSRKDGMEYARRNPTAEGYILWLLVDFGHWCEGLLDDFWNPKDISAEEFLKSNGDTIILLAEEGDRCFEMGTTARIPLAISHYGGASYPGSRLVWRVTVSRPFDAGGLGDGVDVIGEGDLGVSNLAPGELTQVGSAEFVLPPVEEGYKLELHVALHHEGAVVNTNNWSFWAFPEAGDSLEKAAEQGVHVRVGEDDGAIASDASMIVADTVDEGLVNRVRSGATCLLFSKGAVIENTTCYYNDVTFYGIFRTIPWNAGSSGNSGTVISPHPAFQAFPHEGVCDLPFLWMLIGHLPMEFSPLHEYGVTPILRNIDHYYANRNNAYVLEFKVGAGKVLVTSLGILEHRDERIEVRYLLGGLLDYVRGPRFSPVADVPAETFLALFRQRGSGEAPSGPEKLLE